MDQSKSVSSHSAVNFSETQPLISPLSLNRASSVREKLITSVKCLLPRGVCELSRAAVFIILINVVVSAAFATLMNSIMYVGYVSKGVAASIGIVYSIVAVISLFSPLSGFLADVLCGRYRVILVSIVFQFIAFFFYSIMAIATLICGIGIWVTSHYGGGGIALFFLIVAGVAFILFAFGLAGYQANYVQFGLDQLLEAPSTTLALFIHWMSWAESFGVFVVQMCFGFLLCKFQSLQLYLYKPMCCGLIVLMCLLFFTIVLFRRRWFYTEPGHHNPYKMVIKVLNFARKHKYPLQRSAFTYCDDEEPSRIDFAKERYGGPFTTEQVEDVKTFFRILVILLALCPVFVLEVPTSFFMFIVFGIHTSDRPFILNQTCSVTFILLEKGSLSNLTGVVLYPVYIWLVFSAFTHCMPKIFGRLVFSVILYLLGVVSMLSIDLAGHFKIMREGAVANSTSYGSMCMFSVDKTLNKEPVLGLRWAVLLVPSLLLGIGQPLVMATSFEFISAQSPSSMKGLLVGVFLSIQAFFRLLSGAGFFPFSDRKLWDSRSMREHPPVTNCGFGYLSFTCVVALIGLILLSVAVKKYKQRERDDRPYDQRFAVDVYSRYIEQAYSRESSNYYRDEPQLINQV